MTALLFLRAHWRTGILIAMAIVVALALTDARHWHKRYDHERAAHTLDLANVRAATAQAQAADERHAREVQAHDEQIARSTSNALQTQLASARSSVSDYARLHHCATSAGSGRVADLPAPARPSGRADAAGGAPELPSATVGVPAHDLDVCAGNTVRLEAWGDWYNQVAAAPR